MDTEALPNTHGGRPRWLWRQVRKSFSARHILFAMMMLNGANAIAVGHSLTNPFGFAAFYATALLSFMVGVSSANSPTVYDYNKADPHRG